MDSYIRFPDGPYGRCPWDCDFLSQDKGSLLEMACQDIQNKHQEEGSGANRVLQTYKATVAWKVGTTIQTQGVAHGQANLPLTPATLPN